MSVSKRLPSPDLCTGAALLGLSALLFWACTGVKDFAAIGVGSAFVPRLTASLLLLIGLILLSAGWRQRPESTPAHEAAPSGLLAAALSIVLIGAYLALLEPLGFLPASALYGFLQMLVLAKGGERRYLRLATLSLVAAIAFHYLFVNLFEISLPSGILG